MADFHQSASVATLHRLDAGNFETLERELEAFAKRTPIALVLPCLFAELSRPAIHHIIKELRDIRYIDTVVVSLAQATEREFREASAAFARLPQRVSIIWNNNPAVQRLYALLSDCGLDPGPDGKGRGCWIAYGYLLADGRCRVVATHDCDITTYSRELLARLCYPVVHPHLGFGFAKGYYARVSSTLNGRVTRLFVTPLIRALASVVGCTPLLTYLDSFRYPLAGEFAMRLDLARVSRMPANWGLEVGMLAEAYRNCGAATICQTELCANYDHKHQVLSAGHPDKGLMRMSVEIGQTLLRALGAEGVVLTDAAMNALAVRYVRIAQDTIRGYQADALINTLSFDRHGEELMIEAFVEGLRIACKRHLDDGLGVPMMPSWQRVAAAEPEFPALLKQTVDEDAPVAAVA